MPRTTTSSYTRTARACAALGFSLIPYGSGYLLRATTSSHFATSLDHALTLCLRLSGIQA